MQIIFHYIRCIYSRINFTIGETEIPNIFQEEQKFLGKLLFPTGKLSDTFDYLGIGNKAHKYKYPSYFEMNIKSGSRNIISFLRFLLTVHTILQSNLKKLHTFTDKSVKKNGPWITRVVTHGSFFHPALHLKRALDIT